MLRGRRSVRGEDDARRGSVDPACPRVHQNLEGTGPPRVRKSIAGPAGRYYKLSASGFALVTVAVLD